MEGICGNVFRSIGFLFLISAFTVVIWVPKAHCWGKEGHMLDWSGSLLDGDVAEAVRNLLPDYANGDLSLLCDWADQVRHWYRYWWSASLHFIDTPDHACSYLYSRDCHSKDDLEDMCLAGAIRNYTTQLLQYASGASNSRYNMTEALLFLSHFMGDIHQPLHVGFRDDEGGNTILLHWYGHKSNLHHVWDTEIILTAAADFYGKDSELLEKDLMKNVTKGLWSDDITSWESCNDISSCVDAYASESINTSCKWAYKDVHAGETLSDAYFNSRYPIVMERLAKGGVRLAMILNKIFGNGKRSLAAETLANLSLGHGHSPDLNNPRCPILGME